MYPKMFYKLDTCIHTYDKELSKRNNGPPFKIYTENKYMTFVNSVPRHCKPSEISKALRDGTKTQSKHGYLLIKIIEHLFL